MEAAGRTGTWESSSERAAMTPAIASRLGGRPDEPAMRTRYTFRSAFAAEATRLGIRPGSLVVTIARTYFAEERAVETADIVIPVERYAMVYDVPVR
jgi:hypothetical protein